MQRCKPCKKASVSNLTDVHLISYAHNKSLTSLSVHCHWWMTRAWSRKLGLVTCRKRVTYGYSTRVFLACIRGCRRAFSNLILHIPWHQSYKLRAHVIFRILLMLHWLSCRGSIKICAQPFKLLSHSIPCILSREKEATACRRKRIKSVPASLHVMTLLQSIYI